LVTRGLVIEPLRLHPSEMAHFGYGVFFGGGLETAGPSKAAARGLLEGVLAWKGADATPAVLRAEIERSRIDARVKGTLLVQMKVLEKLVSPAHHLADQLSRGGPLLVQLESRYLGPDQVLPLEAALLNALSRPLRDGTDPHRWFLLDELTVHTMNPATERFL